jgi:hypothetical protein
MGTIPLEVVPLTGIRKTKSSTLAKIPSIIPIQVSDASEKLVKSKEDMSIQGEEIGRTKEEVNNLQELKSMFQASHQEEMSNQEDMHKSQMLSQQLQQLHKDIVMKKTLAHDKENIWVDISKSMSKIWPST